MYSLYWSHILSLKDNKKQNKTPKPRKLFHISYHVLVPQLCPTLVIPMGYTPPDSSVHGILQARILGQVAILFSRGSSQPRDGTRASAL